MANNFDYMQANQYSRVQLQDDTVIPAASPNTGQSTVTTWGVILQRLKSLYSRNLGYFSSLENLNSSHPKPQNGLIAYVANSESSTGYYIYNAISGVWVATITPAPAITVDIDSKLDKSAVKQISGTSETDVMSQKAITDLFNSLNTGGNTDGYLPLTGGALTGPVTTRSLISFLDEADTNPVSFGYQAGTFYIANSSRLTKVMGTVLAEKFFVGNRAETAKEVWHKGNLTKLSQLEADIDDKYLRLYEGKLTGELHWTDLQGGETKIGAPGVSNQPHFNFKSTSYDWRFDKNIKIKTGLGETESDYKEVWHKGNLDLTTLNAASADKLKVAVQLWGNTFDGSKSVMGPVKTTKIEFPNGYTIEASGSDLVFKQGITVVATINNSGIRNA